MFLGMSLNCLLRLHLVLIHVTIDVTKGVIMDICTVEWCETKVKHKNRGLCGRHYQQINMTGKAYKTPNDNNRIITYTDHCGLFVRDKYGTEIAEVLFDLVDLEAVSQYIWHMTTTGYIRNNKVGLLHKLLLDIPKGLMCDHINRNPFDNRRSNLRIVTRSDNERNTTKRCNNTTGYKGVVRNGTKYGAQATKDGVHYWLGTYDTVKEAAVAYNKKALELDGKFAYLNEVSL